MKLSKFAVAGGAAVSLFGFFVWVISPGLGQGAESLGMLFLTLPVPVILIGLNQIMGSNPAIMGKQLRLKEPILSGIFRSPAQALLFLASLAVYGLFSLECAGLVDLPLLGPPALFVVWLIVWSLMAMASRPPPGTTGLPRG
jgi:hypothetical protein